MKKVLLSTAAVALAFSAMPAHAEINLNVGGFFKGYAAYVDQDEDGTGEVNNFDFLKSTELHFTGETVLDNGLTIGFHSELKIDGADESAAIDESYMYVSGSWGRVNFGEEDGAGYLLQVAAPSADSNVDGLRSYIQPVNGVVLGLGEDLVLDYDQDPTGKATKLTYLTPVLSGFQAGVSFTPDSDAAADDFAGIGLTDEVDDIGRTYEIAGRYEGQFSNVGFAVGAGYSHGDLEEKGALTEDRKVWNVGLDLDFGPIGFGAVYKEDNFATGGKDEEVIVVGVDYTTGPFKLGASYADFDHLGGDADIDAKRYTGGVVYTYGPGATLRGSVQYVDLDVAGASDVDATSFLIGTQVNF